MSDYSVITNFCRQRYFIFWPIPVFRYRTLIISDQKMDDIAELEMLEAITASIDVSDDSDDSDISEEQDPLRLTEPNLEETKKPPDTGGNLVEFLGERSWLKVENSSGAERTYIHQVVENRTITNVSKKSELSELFLSVDKVVTNFSRGDLSESENEEEDEEEEDQDGDRQVLGDSRILSTLAEVDDGPEQQKIVYTEDGAISFPFTEGTEQDEHGPEEGIGLDRSLESDEPGDLAQVEYLTSGIDSK